MLRTDAFLSVLVLACSFNEAIGEDIVRLKISFILIPVEYAILQSSGSDYSFPDKQQSVCQFTKSDSLSLPDPVFYNT